MLPGRFVRHPRARSPAPAGVRWLRAVRWQRGHWRGRSCWPVDWPATRAARSCEPPHRIRPALPAQSPASATPVHCPGLCASRRPGRGSLLQSGGWTAAASRASTTPALAARRRSTMEPAQLAHNRSNGDRSMRGQAQCSAERLRRQARDRALPPPTARAPCA